MTATKEVLGNIVVHFDKKRKPNYYITAGRLGKIIFESDSVHEAVQWAIKRYNYNFAMSFLYSPKQ